MTYNIPELSQYSILEYCNRKGLAVTGRGSYRRLIDHDSMVINLNKNIFFWNKENVTGDVIDFAMIVGNISKYKALQDVADTFYYEPGNIQQISKDWGGNKGKDQPSIPFDHERLVFTKINQAYAYLIKTRKLNKETVDHFIQKNMIGQGGLKDLETGEVKNNRNVIFKSYDPHERRKMNSAELVGTNKDFRFKKIVEGSRDGIFYRHKKYPDFIIFTESTIDMMSYYELHQKRLEDKKFWLVSMTGLKDVVIKNALEEVKILNELRQKDNKEEIKPTLIMAVDHDKGGLNFCHKVKGKEEFAKEEFKVHVPKEAKDWNELLEKKKAEIEKKKMHQHPFKDKERKIL